MPDGALYSSHHCIGGWDSGVDGIGRADLGSVDISPVRLARNQKERSCLFRNVCFDSRERHRWVYFAKEDEFIGKTRVRAGVDVSARGGFGGNADVSEDHSFTVRRTSLPSSAQWFDAPTVVKLKGLAPTNFGHFLGNALYPAFQLMWRFFGEHAKTMPLQLLLVGHNQSNPDELRSRCARGAEQVRRRAVAGKDARRRGSVRARGKGYVSLSRRLDDVTWPIDRGTNNSEAHHLPSGAAGKGALDSRFVVLRRCESLAAERAAAVRRFVSELLPGLCSTALLWEHSLPALARARSPNGLFCTRRLAVGTGDLVRRASSYGGPPRDTSMPLLGGCCVRMDVVSACASRRRGCCVRVFTSLPRQRRRI